MEQDREAERARAQAQAQAEEEARVERLHAETRARLQAAEREWRNIRLYRVDLQTAGRVLEARYYGCTRYLAERWEEHRSGGARAAALVKEYPYRLPREVGGRHLCEGYAAGRIREMLLVADEIGTEAQETAGFPRVRGGPWLRPNRRDWSREENEALVVIQGFLRRLPGYDRPAGSGGLPGFPVNPTVTVDHLRVAPEPVWRELGDLIAAGGEPNATKVQRLLFGHVTLQRPALPVLTL